MDVVATPDLDELFRDMFDAHHRLVIAFAVRRGFSLEEAEDVLSATFVNAWRHRADAPSVPEEQPAWLLTFALHVLLNERRSARRRRRLGDRVRATTITPVMPDHATGRAEAAVLRQALAELSESDREILMLVGWDGRSHVEIGRILGITRTAVGVRIHRARKRLNKHLAAMEEEARDA